jgi:hypothetical protein
MSVNKKEYGQFYTTNYKYILQNLKIPINVNSIIEPFVGKGDILGFLDNLDKYNLELYDIEPKYEGTRKVIKQDTIVNPPNYKDKFVLTNPPYLARNKSENKVIFDKYGQNDLYKCFMVELTRNKCLGGILIIPLNFWCSIRKGDIELRRMFLSVYSIQCLNIFEEQVFDDTSYTVCSFQFELIKDNSVIQANHNINTFIYPEKKNIIINMNNYLIGYEIYNLPTSEYKIERWTKKNKDSENRTNLMLKCLDDSSTNMINLKYYSNDNDLFIDETDKLSARSYATIVITPAITIDKQQQLATAFNKFLSINRKKYNSLFLTNYRESKPGCSRKRISFKLAFDIINHLLID